MNKSDEGDFRLSLQVLDFVVDGPDTSDTMVELEVYDQHWISDEAVRPFQYCPCHHLIMPSVLHGAGNRSLYAWRRGIDRPAIQVASAWSACPQLCPLFLAKDAAEGGVGVQMEMPTWLPRGTETYAHLFFEPCLLYRHRRRACGSGMRRSRYRNSPARP